MKYKFNIKILDDNFEELHQYFHNDKQKFYPRLAEIENTMYAAMKKHYDDLRDYYTYQVACSDYHDIMVNIINDYRDSDSELSQILRDYVKKISVS